MRTWLCCLFAAALTACGAAPAPAPAWESVADPGFLDQLAATYRFRLGRPSAVTVLPGDGGVLFLQSGPRSFERALYRFDPKTGRATELLTAAALLNGASEELTPEEKARRERLRLAAKGIARYSVSRDGQHLLTLLSGRPFVYTLATGKTVDVLGPDAAPVQDAHLSPDGQKLAFVRGGELWWTPVRDAAPVQLTTGASDTVSHGLAEFVAQEEMGRLAGLWWSPEGDALAYQRTDTAGMERFYLPTLTDPAIAPSASPYPRPGKANAQVQLFVRTLTADAPVEITWDRAAHPYLARVVWAKDAPLTFVTQNRRQTELTVRTADAATGQGGPVHTETDAAWVELDADMPRWLPKGCQFLWTTERNGHWQLEVRNADGTLSHAVTPPTFGYAGLVHVDTDGGYAVVAGGPDPTQRQLYKVPLGGDAAPTPWTTDGGWHALTVAKGTADAPATVAVHTHTPEHGPTTWQVRPFSADGLGDPLGPLPDRAEAPGFDVQVTWQTLEVQGRTHHAQVVRPRNFKPGWRYPVIFHVYGGPTHAMVRRVASGLERDQWLADHGFIVVRADGRATPGRGRDWGRALGDDFAQTALEDGKALLTALGRALPELDLDRVGVYGWSFGGYLAAMATLRAPEVFKAGIAGAPVTDWRDYDTHYTERYIGLPDTDKAVYDASDVLTYADRLARPLLIIHGTGDDNVYFAHALRLSDALLRAGKPHDFLALAGHSHMVSDAAVTRGEYARVIGFFHAHLGAPTRP